MYMMESKGAVSVVRCKAENRMVNLYISLPETGGTEAMNEAYGPETDGLGNGKSALWAVNQIRTRSQYPNLPEYMGQRGGMPSIPSGMGKEEMRERIRHERRIELAFEEHRFWDVRRWMIA